mgnify:CR=1 FL=1
MQKPYCRAPAASPRSLRRLLGDVLLALFLAGGLFCGYLFYASVRDIVAYADLPFEVYSPALVTLGEHPAQTISFGERLPRQPTERVNILFLGIDRRHGEPGPWRSDTMILFSIDPSSKTASMLSIPRDLWVPIPGYGENRINAAHAYGDQYGYPGGGPALAKETIRHNLGVPVHYYARMDFRGFERIIDEIGGIDVEVPRDIVDEAYPTEDYGTMRIAFTKGWQHLNGQQALQYARTRHDSSDLDRGRRQQQIVLAVRDKVLRLGFPLSRLPALLAALGDSVKTDLTLDEMAALAQVVRQVRPQDICQGIIDETMAFPAITPAGAEILVPDHDQIRVLVARLFPVASRSVSTRPLSASADPLP